MKPLLCMLVISVCVSATTWAQQTPPKTHQNFLAPGLQVGYAEIKDIVKQAAEKMPEAHYGFKPHADAKTFGQVISHMSNTHFTLCALLRKEANPNQGNNLETKTVKADIIKSMNESFAFCDVAFAAATEENIQQMILGPSRVLHHADHEQDLLARGLIMTIIIRHDNRYFGMASVLMWLKGVVPPSRE